MQNLKNRIVPYDIALQLKAIGFDEPCFRYYCEDNAIRTGIKDWMSNNLFDEVCNSSVGLGNVAAPLYQDVFEWFNEKFGLDVNYSVAIPTSYMPNIHFSKEIGLSYRSFKMMRFFYLRVFDSKQEANNECIKALIDAIKVKQTSEEK